MSVVHERGARHARAGAGGGQGHDRVLRVVLADDAPLFRSGLGQLLGSRGVQVVAEAEDGDGLLHAVHAHRPDVAVVDVRMPPTRTDEGLRAAGMLQEAHPQTGVLLLSGDVQAEHLEPLLRRGARGVGYLLKDRVGSVEELVAALRRLADGGSAFDPDVVRQVVRRRRSTGALDALTPREREVLALMAEGLSNTGIAERLHLSPKTVERHVGSVFLGLGLEPADDGHRRVLAVLRHLGAA